MKRLLNGTTSVSHHLCLFHVATLKEAQKQDRSWWAEKILRQMLISNLQENSRLYHAISRADVKQPGSQGLGDYYVYIMYTFYLLEQVLINNFSVTTSLLYFT